MIALNFIIFNVNLTWLYSFDLIILNLQYKKHTGKMCLI